MDPVRQRPSVCHVDLDAFFAAVEQRDKPSLRGKPVVVGGTGPRGVVATASYEARRYGVHSAMSTAEARARCPHAAFLSGRFGSYRAVSAVVMTALSELTPVVEPLSLDEAFLDLDARAAPEELTYESVRALGHDLKTTVRERTGLTASFGAATSKLVAKIASDLEKPDGLVVVEPGTEQELLAPMPVRALPGVGPATAERLLRLGVRAVGDLDQLTDDELVDLLGTAHGSGLRRLARGLDDRRVVPERESKSVSVEETFDRDIVDGAVLVALVERMAARVCGRLAAESLSGRTVTVKVRLPDFSTHTRSATLPGPTDDGRVVARVGRRLLADVETGAGVRLLGVGVSGLADWVQEDLFSSTEPVAAGLDQAPLPRPERRWAPGADVVHAAQGPGWVWGSGLGRVTVRFETRETAPGPVRTFAEDDPDLAPAPVDA